MLKILYALSVIFTNGYGDGMLKLEGSVTFSSLQKQNQECLY